MKKEKQERPEGNWNDCLSGLFLYYRKLRHSVVSRWERMRSSLWDWPLGQLFLEKIY